MAAPGSYLMQLADEFGISSEFWDWKGRLVLTSDETYIAILDAFGVDASNDEKAAAALEERRNMYWLRTLPPCVVQTQGRDWRVYVHVPHGSWVNLTVITEDGNYIPVTQVEHNVPPREIRGNLIGEAAFDLPLDLPLGYHTLRATTEHGVVESALVVSPRTLEPPRSLGNSRAWGYAIQLYSVMSEDSWGIGDLRDLADFGVWAGGYMHADYVLVNPLEAAAPQPPLEDSPYLPTSRSFLNPIYIRPEAIEEYAALLGKERDKIGSVKRSLKARLASESLIDRDLVMASKISALWVVFEQPRRLARELALQAFVGREGVDLQRFARWCVLSREYGLDWRVWPAQLQQPDSYEVEQYCGQRQRDVDFYIWLQWVADTQLREAQSESLDAGMRIGIMSDQPVGVGVASQEYWSASNIFADGVTAGAPPDFYNGNGQEWGQIPWRPDRLEETAYDPFKRMIRSVIRQAGGVRIDHIMGLFRLWWVPTGLNPTQGAYVRYNHEALVGILALEAHRAGALVVGEDLGVVEPWVRQYLAERGILGTSVVWFENWDDGSPKPPEQWREACMASVGSHDMPPSQAYLALEHIELLLRLGLLTGTLDEETEKARAQQERLLRVLRERGLLTGDENTVEETILGLYRYLATTPAKLLSVSLTDAVGDRRVQNQPGTYTEYPNWRQPLTNPAGERETLEKLFADD
ncbi:MAG: 4-alpha-glucanotransferase, partial [Propionibacteriaceae bacterium]|nr:4-alpha-glucanotransferase [Propionibacteriaceae bacterium]